MRSWMIDPNTAENAATFMFNICWTCQRLWNDTLRAETRPYTLCNSVGFNYVLQHANEGNPPEYDLPEWTPTACQHKLPI